MTVPVDTVSTSPSSAEIPAVAVGDSNGGGAVASTTSIFELWHYDATDMDSILEYSIDNYCKSLDTSPRVATSPVVSIKCFKDQGGRFGHEFVVIGYRRPLQKPAPDGSLFDGHAFMRLDRAADESGVTVLDEGGFFGWAFSLFHFRLKSSSSIFPVVDKAVICKNEKALINKAGKTSLIASMGPKKPVHLGDTRHILLALRKASSQYTFPKENCYFFSSAILQVLEALFGLDFLMGKIKHVSLASELKKKIVEDCKKAIDSGHLSKEVVSKISAVTSALESSTEKEKEKEKTAKP